MTGCSWGPATPTACPLSHAPIPWGPHEALLISVASACLQIRFLFSPEDSAVWGKGVRPRHLLGGPEPLPQTQELLEGCVHGVWAEAGGCLCLPLLMLPGEWPLCASGGMMAPIPRATVWPPRKMFMKHTA